MLIGSGYKEDDGSDPSPLRDLSTKAEETLGRLVSKVPRRLLHSQ